jgi:endonuclease/exonuclease/phosphatase family metal-dependent hydrolase
MPWSDPSRQVVDTGNAPLPRDAFTAVTFNMLHGFGSRANDATLEDRLALLVEGIVEELPDVVLLQEVSITPRHGNVAERLREALNARLGARGISYGSVFAMANGSRLVGFFEGSAILARGRILSAGILVYEAQALLPPERRIALRATIAAAGERGREEGIEVVSTHLTNTGARRGGRLVRELQAEELARWLGKTKAAGQVGLVVGGDFNDTPGSRTVREILASGARDAWVEAGAAAAPRRIDYIFVGGPSLRAESAAAFLGKPRPRSTGGVLRASDHVGVLARITRQGILP